ncbi:MAG: hypothetical protein QXS21_05540 [Thermoproteota archaeon]
MSKMEQIENEAKNLTDLIRETLEENGECYVISALTAVAAVLLSLYKKIQREGSPADKYISDVIIKKLGLEIINFKESEKE